MKYLEIIPDLLTMYGVFTSQCTSQVRQEMSTNVLMCMSVTNNLHWGRTLFCVNINMAYIVMHEQGIHKQQSKHYKHIHTLTTANYFNKSDRLTGSTGRQG